VNETASKPAFDQSRTPATFAEQSSQGIWTAGVLLLLLSAMITVAGTWTVFSATFDEPYHIACGMQWLQKGAYTYEMQHPPLARAMFAVVPYLRGLRAHSLSHPMDEGNAILFSAGDPRTNLALARSGNLLFLSLSVLVVFLWARRWFGAAATFWSVLLFLSLPPILGHAGLATVDMACAATTVLALYAFVRLLEDFTRRRLVLAAASVGLAFACKFSSIAFLGSCFFFTLLYFAATRRASLQSQAASWRSLLRQLALASGIVFVILWATYRFETHPISYYLEQHQELQRKVAATPMVRSAAKFVAGIPIPLSTTIRGIYAVVHHNAIGHDAYLFGKFSNTGWWYFFPVVLAVKTPIPFLLLTALGAFFIARGFRSRPWQQHLTIVFAVSILLVCMSSRINLGVRHILPVYLLLAVMGGHAIAELFALARSTSAILAMPVLLVAWAVADAWFAHPDYLAWFNSLAGAHPEKVLVESDLDWGQDLYRLGPRLKELHVDHVSVLYFGVTPLETAGLPPYTVASPSVPVTHGYLAVSVRYLTLSNARDGSCSWLKGREPVEAIGKSIYLYNLGP
jgi:4-amino-4-deoxy-L-arabinose transferase-like glycosyltransferase